MKYPLGYGDDFSIKVEDNTVIHHTRRFVLITVFFFLSFLDQI